MRKHVLALLAAILITGVTALGMFVIGVNALVNPNTTTISNSVSAAVTQDPSSSNATYQAQIAQLQSLVNQYQARDQQYQQIINQDNQQLQQASNEMQMIQQLLGYLQQQGLIRITNDGRIIVTGGNP
jgi:uncharacterized protein YlxW (UPF0749 family)